jgi:hypothetical protein
MKRVLRPLFLGGIVAIAAGAAIADSITFYESDNYGGRQFTADRPVANFARNGFNDRVRSAVVHDGRWEICVDAEFGGSCGVLGPGAYPNLGAYAGRVSSVRPLEGRQTGTDARSHDNRADNGGRNRKAQATLFEGANLSGRAYPIDETMQNLGRTGFNDRASSLRVESGYWIFCTDADFRGECRTFGPGDYATLPGMNDAISSGRRISNEYPYRDRPNWQQSQLNPAQR